jgi:hypothetical protein
MEYYLLQVGEKIKITRMALSKELYTGLGDFT